MTKIIPAITGLPYEPSNYLPSCQICNQGGAKANNFPITGTRAYKPADSLAAELPLLLNPYEEDCRMHIQFSPSGSESGSGRATGITEKGRTTIEVLNLNRMELVERRLQSQRLVRMLIKQALVKEDTAALTQLVSECALGEREYSAAAICEIEDYCALINLLSPIS